MKKIFCELCDGTEFIKEGGMFVCQGCGTKYSMEEAKSMMREVGDDAAPAAGAPVVPMGNPNQQQIDNLLVLATTAYEAQNYAEAETYCNKAIELDAMCYKAWNLKGKAAGWQSKIDDLRIEEAAHFFCKAIDFAPEEEKEDLKNQAVEEIKRLGLALISLRKNRFSGSPDKEELQGFSKARKVVLDALMVLLSHGNAVGMPDGYLDEIATLMNQAGVAALNMARKAWAKVDHPSEKDFDTYLEWNGNICQIFRESIRVSDGDEEADITRYKNLIIALEEPMDVDACSYTRQWSSYYSRYEWVREYSLAQSAKDSRRREVQECKDKIAEIERNIRKKKEEAARKAEEEKRQRIEAYWAAHAEEKARLEEERDTLTQKQKDLSKRISKLDQQISAETPSGKVPSEVEMDLVQDQIKDLEKRRAGLGIFAGKEKKQIAEQIASLNGRLDTLKAKAEEEKKARSAEASKKTRPMRDEKAALQKEVEAAKKRISAIEAELTKDPEA